MNYCKKSYSLSVQETLEIASHLFFWIDSDLFWNVSQLLRWSLVKVDKTIWPVSFHTYLYLIIFSFHAKNLMKLIFLMWLFKNIDHLKWHIIFSMPNRSWSSSWSAQINCKLQSNLIFKNIKIITFFLYKKLLQPIWINHKNKGR